jgi:PKD repeat protein
MRTTTSFALLAGVASLALLTGCTVKDVDAPSLAGPSTFAHSITMVADRDTLTQNGVDFTDIRITSLGPNGQSETIPLRAQIYVDGVPQDFGTLSTKTPTTPTTIRYTAPPASTISGAQGAQTVQIAVTPSNLGDFAGEFTRHISLKLEPQGIILPSNPNLVPAFTVTPGSPQAGVSATFDASTSTNNGSPCGVACSYAWDFGDGQTSTGITTSHAYTKPGNYTARLTVTDARGASAVLAKSVTVTAGTPPTAQFRMTPTPAPVGVDVFFNASEAQAAPGRTLVSYSWDFGDGQTASGVTQAHRYSGSGLYTVVLTVTDDIGVSARNVQSLQVGQTTQAVPVAQLTANPASIAVNGRIVFDATASTPSTGGTIVLYRFNYGDGSPVEEVTNPVQSHVYTVAGTFVATVEIVDSNGKSATKTATVTITP